MSIAPLKVAFLAVRLECTDRRSEGPSATSDVPLTYDEIPKHRPGANKVPPTL